MKTPLISIVLNNYNYGKYVGKAIESALAQTYDNVEVVIVDDGSSDNSKEVITSFAIEKTYFKENGGQVSAQNLGFEKSTGDIVIFLDSDDYLYPELCTTLAKNYSPNIMMYPYKLRICDENGIESHDEMPRAGLILNDHCQHLMKYGYMPISPMSGVAYHRDFLSQVFPFDEIKWNNSIDHYLSFTAPFFGEVLVLNQPLGGYRMGHMSISQHPLISFPKFRLNLLYSTYYAEAIASLAFKHFNKNIAVETLLSAYHWKNRFFSYVLSPDKHPFKQDNRFTLITRSIAQFIKADDIELPKRVKNVVLMAILLLCPRTVIKKYAEKYRIVGMQDM
jgi:glycosyltransferase involved in cell wall biosynthesis